MTTGLFQWRSTSSYHYQIIDERDQETGFSAIKVPFVSLYQFGMVNRFNSLYGESLLCSRLLYGAQHAQNRAQK